MRNGFSLIELMIVVAIIGILSAIAYPSYTGYVMEGRRTEAIAELARLQMEQEKWRASNATYATMAQLGSPTLTYYTLTDTTAPTAAAYSITATATGAQTGDTGCTTLTVTNSTRTPTTCFSQ